MSELTTPDQMPAGHDWRSALEDLRGAYAETTISSYRKDFGLFESWCNEQGLSALPCAPETLVRYFEEKIQTLKSSTLIRRLSALVRVHRLLGLASPADDERVRIARRRILRYRPNRPRQVQGIDRDLRTTMLAGCAETLAGRRDKALVALGFEGDCAGAPRSPRSSWMTSSATARVSSPSSFGVARPTRMATAGSLRYRPRPQRCSPTGSRRQV